MSKTRRKYSREFKIEAAKLSYNSNKQYRYVCEWIQHRLVQLVEETMSRLLDGQPVSLSPTEFKLLHFMMKHPDRVLSRGRLLDGVWGDQVFIEERTVDVHIRRLRLALQPSGHDRLVETVRGGGYRFLPA